MRHSVSVRRRQVLTSRCPSDLAPECAKTTITGASWMWRKHHIRCGGARADRFGYRGGTETVIGVSDRFKPCEGRRGLHIPAGAVEGDASWRNLLPVGDGHSAPGAG